MLFSWEGCQIDDLMAIRSFFQEGRQIDNFTTTILFSWKSHYIDDLMAIRLFPHDGNEKTI